MTNEERKVFELALEALLKTQNEGFNLPGSAIREAITAIKEALAQPKEPDQDEVDIRSRLYQRIHELECVLKDIAEYTGEGPPTTDWQGIVKLISDSARNALEDKEIKQPEQEPVGQLLEDAFGRGQVMWFNKPKDESMLYTTPPQRNPLTDDEMWKLWNSQGDDAMEQQAAIAFARDIEAAHNIKE